MQTIKIKYDPYKMETTMSINGTDIRNIPSYSHLRKFFDTHTPLQTWIEPIKYKNWNGLINELVAENDYDKLEIYFSGRVIDYQDLKRACEAQNQERKDYKLSIKYHHPEIISDKKLSENIDNVVQQLLTDEFQALVEARGQNSQVYKDYQRLANDYEETKNREFKIVFAGLFSSGKSTILNSIIRHDVLPTSDNTCTAKTCKIKHDSSLHNSVSLTCYDSEGAIVVPTEVFNTDEDCRKRFWEITPLGATVSNPESVEIIEIGVDLSHLYPTEDMKRRFNIVIVDTPGCNSSKTKGQNIKQDISIALDAITDGAKEMVIICAAGQDYENESLGTFLKAINDMASEDAGDFNDRFLFVLNKCDGLTYKEEIGESITQKKNAFYKYLTEPWRWGFASTERSPDFVPKVMLMSAIAYETIRSGVYDMGKAAAYKNSTRTRDMYKMCDNFKDLVIDCVDENYHLARYCDIPKYRLLELEQRFTNCLNEGNESEAVSIQSGVECVEMSIRDYIERYAYPFKVRDLMETFDALLEDITEFVNFENQAYQNAKDALGKTISAGEEAEKERKEKEQEESRLQSIKLKIEEQKERINNINYTYGEVHQISADFDAAVESSPKIKRMRTLTGKILGKDLNQYVNDIYTVIKEQWEIAQARFETHTKTYKGTLSEIKAELQSIRDALDIEKDEFNFSSLSAMKQLESFSEESFRAAAITTKKTETIQKKDGTKPNPIKTEKYKWWQFGKKVKQFFADDYVDNIVTVQQDTYEVSALLSKLTDITTQFAKICEQTEMAFLEDIATAKSVALRFAEDVTSDLDAITESIKTLREKIDSIKSNLPSLEAKQKEIQNTLDWLKELKDLIDKRGEDNV